MTLVEHAYDLQLPISDTQSKYLKAYSAAEVTASLLDSFRDIPYEFTDPSRIRLELDRLSHVAEVSNRRGYRFAHPESRETVFDSKVVRLLLIDFLDAGFAFNGLRAPQEVDSNTILGDAYDYYKRDMSKFPLLTDAEEVYLFWCLENNQMPKTKDGKSIVEAYGVYEDSLSNRQVIRDHLVYSNMGTVSKVATQYFLDSGVAIDDLVQEGNIQTLRSIAKFEFRRGLKFSGYHRRAVYFGLKRFTGKENHPNFKIVLTEIREENLDNESLFADEQDVDTPIDMEGALAALQSHYSRQVEMYILLAYGLSMDEIGQRYGGISRQAVSNTLVPVKARMKELLSDYQ